MLPKIRDSIEIRQDGDDLHFIYYNTSERKVFAVDNTFRQMIPLLDGTNDEHQLLASLQAVNPELTLEELVSILGAMLDHRIIEDLAKTPPFELPELTANERETFNRQILFFEEYAPSDLNGPMVQQVLKKSNVVIFGLGGTGSWIASFLAQAGIGTLTLVDFDTVERSNLSRQTLYRTSDIGSLKVEAAAKRLQEISPTLQVRTHTFRLEEHTDLNPVLTDADIVVNCTDSPNVFTTGMWIAKACMPRKIPHLIGGGYSRHLGMVGPTILPYRTPCWGCYAKIAPAKSPEDDLPILHARTATSAASFNMISTFVSSIQAFEVIKVLTRITQPSMIGRKAEIDMFKLNMNFEVFRRHPRCELCGRTATGGGDSCPN